MNVASYDDDDEDEKDDGDDDYGNDDFGNDDFGNDDFGDDDYGNDGYGDDDYGNDADHVERVRDLWHAVKVKAACIARHSSRTLAQKSLVKKY